MKERGRVRTMNEVLKEAWRNYKPRHGAVVEIGTEDKETGRMANLKATDEEWAKLDDAQRAEAYATERGRVVEDLLHRCIGEVAESRAGLKRGEKRISEAEMKAHRLHWDVRRLVDRLTLALQWIQADHMKRFPRHKRSTGAAAHKGCKACQLALAIAKDVEDLGKELAR